MFSKRLILILTFFVVCHFSQDVTAQKPILGLALGKTTVEEATIIIQDQRLQIFSIYQGIPNKRLKPDNIFCGENIRFGGITWGTCMLRFEQNHFTSASFSLGNLQESNAESYFDTLSEALKRNYPDFSEMNDKWENSSRLILKNSNLYYSLICSKAGDYWCITLTYIYTGKIKPSQEMNEL